MPTTTDRSCKECIITGNQENHPSPVGSSRQQKIFGISDPYIARNNPITHSGPCYGLAYNMYKGCEKATSSLQLSLSIKINYQWLKKAYANIHKSLQIYCH